MTVDVHAAAAAILGAFARTSWRVYVSRADSRLSAEDGLILWYDLVPDEEWSRAVLLEDQQGSDLRKALPGALISLEALYEGGERFWDELDALLGGLPVTVVVTEDSETLAARIRQEARRASDIAYMHIMFTVCIGALRAVPYHEEPIQISTLFPCNVIDEIS